MAYDSKKQSHGSFSSDSASLDSWDDISKLVEAANQEKKFLSYDELLFKLRKWWATYYKRPYKDPLLDSYTFEELLFEYLDVNYEQGKPSTEQKVAEAIEAEDRAWAEEEADKEMADEEAQAVEQANDAEARAIEQSDSIEAGGMSDSAWADKVLANPSADQVDEEGGDISATFEG